MTHLEAAGWFVGMFLAVLGLAALIDWLGGKEQQPPADNTRGLEDHARYFEENGEKVLKTWRLKPRKRATRKAG